MAHADFPFPYQNFNRVVLPTAVCGTAPAKKICTTTVHPDFLSSSTRTYLLVILYVVVVAAVKN